MVEILNRVEISGYNQENIKTGALIDSFMH